MMMMMLVCFLFVTASLVNGQDYLTCLRNSDAFAGINPQDTASNIRGPPGYPGKRGSPGDRGLQGDKGSKGEPGSSDREEIRRLRADLLSETQALINDAIRPLQDKISRLSQAASSQVAESGWYTPSNGYQYRLTETEQNWQESRRLCQAMGGDLAAVGMRNVAIRWKLLTEVIKSVRGVWIGLNDISQEGQWMWIDGVREAEGNDNWAAGEPNHAGNEDCAVVNVPRHIGAHDVSCSRTEFAICEKIITDISQ
ncbi:CD209 antigen-like protein 2 isoform X1 [Clavelina lepadiformis]|uniref:CD209 antigen-like protein 2 isoform X1 n=1 Tax=Clavelina lepadiformis TaxID=159417 RepID=UPI00404382B2